MKKAILLVVMVAVSTIATAQTFDSPVFYKNIKKSKPYEWVMLDGDTTIALIYGDKSFINQVAYEWFEEYGLDITKPDDKKSDKHNNIDIWYSVNEYNEPLRIAIYESENIKTFVVALAEQ